MSRNIDDIALLLEQNREDIKEILKTMKYTFKSCTMKVNKSKTKIGANTEYG